MNGSTNKCKVNISHTKSPSKENRMYKQTQQNIDPNGGKKSAVNTSRLEENEISKENIDDDIATLSKLSYMNAGARYELLSINQQLLDFDLKFQVFL